MKNNTDLKKTITRAFGWDFIGITFISLSTFLVTVIGVNFLGEAKMGIFAYILTLQGTTPANPKDAEGELYVDESAAPVEASETTSEETAVEEEIQEN